MPIITATIMLILMGIQIVELTRNVINNKIKLNINTL